MKINAIRINGFKGVDNYRFNPEQTTAFVGANATGKTSTLDAIRFLLTGEAGEGVIRDGCTKAVVTADIETVGMVTREVSLKPDGTTLTKVRANGRATTQKSLNQLLQNASNTSLDAAKVITSSKVLTQMKAGDLSEFLVSSGLIPVDIDLKKFQSLCPMSKSAAAELSMVLPESPRTFGLSEIENAYNLFFANRAALKKELAETKAKAVWEGETPTKSIDGIDKELAAILVAKGKGSAQKKLLDNYQTSVAAYQKAKADLDAMALQIKENRATKPDEAEGNFLKNSVAKTRDDIAARKSTYAILSGNIDVFKKSLDKLDTPICPLSDKLVCATDKTPVKEEIQASLDANLDELQKIEVEIKDKEDNLASILEKQAIYNESVSLYAEKLALYDKYEFLKKNMPVVPEEPTDASSISEEEFDDREAELKAERQACVRFDIAQENAKKALDIEARIAVIEEVVGVLNPKKGIREKIIENALAPLITYCNDAAAELRPGFEISITVDKGTHIMCKPNSTTKALELSAASSGEQLFATFLITDMLNALSGYGVLFIDDLDKLDEKAFESLIDVLCSKRVKSAYDHIFIAGVNHDNIKKALKAHSSDIDVVEL